MISKAAVKKLLVGAGMPELTRTRMPYERRLHTNEDIQLVGFASAAANSVSLPSGAADGDLLLVCAYRTTDTTLPTVPGTYSTIITSNGNTNAMVTGFRTMSGDTTTGTWTNATHIMVVVLRRVGTVGNFSSASGTTSSITMAATTLAASTSPRSFVIVFVGNRTATNVNSQTISGAENQSPGQTNLACHVGRRRSTGLAVSWTVNAASSWRAIQVEVRADAFETRPFHGLMI